jgi:hypothetical protein
MMEASCEAGDRETTLRPSFISYTSAKIGANTMNVVSQRKYLQVTGDMNVGN